MAISIATMRVLNQSFGKLTVIKIFQKTKSNKKRAYAKCDCKCGNTKIILVQNLLNGSTKSCGCLLKLKSKIASIPEYRVYYNILQRCYNKNNPRYEDWGGRGIVVHKRYLGKYGLKHLLKDIGQRPSSKYSIDRIDNDGDYEPGNLKWSTRREQQNNKRKYKLKIN